MDFTTASLIGADKPACDLSPPEQHFDSILTLISMDFFKNGLHSMSEWNEYHLGDKIMQILQEPLFHLKEDHPFGAPYVSVYQLAVAFEHRYPELCRELEKVMPIAGSGKMGAESLPVYFANQLSQRIKNIPDYPIEGIWLSSTGLDNLHYKYNGHITTGGPNVKYGGFSLFRLKT